MRYNARALVLCMLAHWYDLLVPLIETSLTILVKPVSKCLPWEKVYGQIVRKILSSGSWKLKTSTTRARKICLCSHSTTFFRVWFYKMLKQVLFFLPN